VVQSIKSKGQATRRSQSACNHDELRCLNQFELIRKYTCMRCGAVMMCDCDRLIGEKFLPHQLDQGTEFETQRTIPVTAGFQPSIAANAVDFSQRLILLHRFVAGPPRSGVTIGGSLPFGKWNYSMS